MYNSSCHLVIGVSSAWHLIGNVSCDDSNVVAQKATKSFHCSIELLDQINSPLHIDTGMAALRDTGETLGVSEACGPTLHLDIVHLCQNVD